MSQVLHLYCHQKSKMAAANAASFFFEKTWTNVGYNSDCMQDSGIILTNVPMFSRSRNSTLYCLMQGKSEIQDGGLVSLTLREILSQWRHEQILDQSWHQYMRMSGLIIHSFITWHFIKSNFQVVCSRISMPTWVCSGLPCPLLYAGQCHRWTFTSPICSVGSLICTENKYLDNWP